MKPHGKDMGKAFAKMQHRHYATIAAIIRDMAPKNEWTREQVAGHFAALLRQTNEKFSRDRFLAACMADNV